MAKDDHIKTIQKCVDILTYISDSETYLNLEELTQKTGYKKTTCFRLLKSMQDAGLIEPVPLTKRYQFGPKLVSFGLTAFKKMNLCKIALPILQKIRDDTRETINLTVLTGTEILYVERLMSDYLVNVNVNKGDRLPAYCASMGKAILAFMPESRVDEIISQIDFRPRTERTIASAAALKQQLVQIRARGYAINDEELERGLRAVAAPIFNYNGEAFAAVNIAWTTARHPEIGIFETFAEKIMEAAGQISSLMGYSGRLGPEHRSSAGKYSSMSTTTMLRANE